MEYCKVSNITTGVILIMPVSDYNTLSVLPNFNLELLESDLDENGFTPDEAIAYQAKIDEAAANKAESNQL